MYEQETEIAKRLAEVLSSKRGKPFRKEIIVEENCGGSIEVSRFRVVIDPFFLTEGNPVSTIEHVLDVSEEFDRRYERQTLSAIIDLKAKLRFCLRELSRLDPDSIQSIVEEELGMGDHDVISLRIEA